MSTIAVIIITLNEERNITACLSSVRWVDELIVLDSQSNDRTVEIARRFTDKVFDVPWQGFSENKNLALSYVTADWVFWIDADERMTPELATEIRQVIEKQPPENGFECARRAYFLGKWIRHCGWYPGFVLRLFRRNCASFSDNRVHEGLVLQGQRGQLHHDLLHFTDDSLEHYLWKFNRYTSFAAEELESKGKKTGFLNILSRPLHTFQKMYILKGGFLDGIQGFMLCLLSAGYVMVKYVKLWEKTRLQRVTGYGGFKK